MGTSDLHSRAHKTGNVTWCSGLTHFGTREADMDGQMKRFAISFLIVSLLLIAFPQDASATPPQKPILENEDIQDKNNGKELESPNVSATEPQTSVFPNHLDINSLQNMPLIILHPRTPINFQMLPGENLSSIHKSLNPSKILELLQSATAGTSVKSPTPSQGENREARNKNFHQRQPKPSVNRPVSMHSDSQLNEPALARSLSNNGWLQKFRGSFSNVFPMLKPIREIPLNFGLPTVNLPVFLPQQSTIHGTISPFPLGSLQQFQSLPWRNLNFHTPSIVHIGDLSADASHLAPLKMLFGHPQQNHFRPPQFPQHHFGGDLATSGSTFIPRRVLPFPHPGIPRFTPPVQRHKPLFNNVGGLKAASMEISNAFADFTDSKEHGPEVTQRFGSVGHTINNFLKMMGLGSDDIGGFGGGASFASLDSTPIARSMDFYPGYGNQAHLDDFDELDEMDDFPVFQEDITQKFMNKMNLTNATSEHEKKTEKETPKKEAMSIVKVGMEVTDKSKMLLNKGAKVKGSNVKISSVDQKDLSYAPAVPLEKDNVMKDGAYKTESEDVKMKDNPAEGPVVSYNIPSIHSTVAPHDRKQPIAIYQHFSANKDAPKPPAYAPAQAMPNQEGEVNPNKLVDEDVVRQWRLVNNGQGFVEKRPVPIVDILKTSTHPESLKVLQKVLSDTGKANSN